MEKARDSLGGEGDSNGVLPAVGVSVVDVCSDDSFSMTLEVDSFDPWDSYPWFFRVLEKADAYPPLQHPGQWQSSWAKTAHLFAFS